MLRYGVLNIKAGPTRGLLRDCENFAKVYSQLYNTQHTGYTRTRDTRAPQQRAALGAAPMTRNWRAQCSEQTGTSDWCNKQLNYNTLDHNILHVHVIQPAPLPARTLNVISPAVCYEYSKHSVQCNNTDFLHQNHQ